MGRRRPGQIPPGAPGHPRVDEGQTSPVRGHGYGREPPERRESEGPRQERANPLRQGRGRPSPRPRFVYEDEDIIAVEKPAGLPVIAPDGSRARSLYDIVTERIRARNPKGRAALVHRLDKDTSGIMIFAKQGRAKKLIMGSWDEIVTERKYIALVEGEMPSGEGLLDSWLEEDAKGRVRSVAHGARGGRGAKRAKTRWKVLEWGEAYSLLELSLETGRRHQIRVQLADIGHPVAGDERYGSRTDPLGRLCLHARSIALHLPGREENLRFECEAPPSFRAALGRVTAIRGAQGGDRAGRA
jgi:23S rRNA pseudouridine1911/1915/1917 synthase